MLDNAVQNRDDRAIEKNFSYNCPYTSEIIFERVKSTETNCVSNLQRFVLKYNREPTIIIIIIIPLYCTQIVQRVVIHY